MAKVDTYPRPKVRKVYDTMWRVTWADVHNTVWYRDFYRWETAVRYAITGKVSGLDSPGMMW